MKLVFIHGAPASGKLTTAKALLARVSGRLFDNHAAIDVARTIFDFGAAGFWELVRAVRLTVLDAASAGGVPLVVMTFVYVEPDDLPTFEQFEAVIRRNGGQMLPVFLQCSDEEIIRRIGNDDRAHKKKMTSEQSARSFLTQHKAVSVPRPNCLVLDSGGNSADLNAQEIIRRFSLT